MADRIKFNQVNAPDISKATALAMSAYDKQQEALQGLVDVGVGMPVYDANGRLTRDGGFTSMVKQANNDEIMQALFPMGKAQITDPNQVNTTIDSIMANNPYGYNKAAINNWIDTRAPELTKRIIDEQTAKNGLYTNQENGIRVQELQDAQDSKTYAATKAQLSAAITSASASGKQAETARLQSILTDLENRARNEMSPYAYYTGNSLSGTYSANSFKASNELINAKNAQIDAQITRLGDPFTRLWSKLDFSDAKSDANKNTYGEINQILRDNQLDINDPLVMNKLISVAEKNGIEKEKAKLTLEGLQANIDGVYGNLDIARNKANAAGSTGGAASKADNSARTGLLTSVGLPETLMDNNSNKLDIPRTHAEFTNRLNTFKRTLNTGEYVDKASGKPMSFTQYVGNDPDQLTKSWTGASDPQAYVSAIQKHNNLTEAEKIELFKLASRNKLDTYQNQWLGRVGNKISNTFGGIDDQINYYLQPELNENGVPKTGNPRIRDIVQVNRKNEFMDNFGKQLNVLDQMGESKQKYLVENANSIKDSGLLDYMVGNDAVIVNSALAKSGVKNAANTAKGGTKTNTAKTVTEKAKEKKPKYSDVPTVDKNGKVTNPDQYVSLPKPTPPNNSGGNLSAAQREYRKQLIAWKEEDDKRKAAWKNRYNN